MPPQGPESAGTEVEAGVLPDLSQQVGKVLSQLLDTVPHLDSRVPLYVGLSGGRDSLALLHLMRFFPPWRLDPGQLRAIHVDHGMHAASRAQADWVAGVCRSWDVLLRRHRPPVVPGTEAEARTMRYACFREEVGGENGGLLLLAHHAEDQAETVLFRLLRGTGPRGLAGIPQARPLTPGSRGWLVRPLLGVSGVELAGWVLQHRLRPKEDPTNVDLAYRRNWLRHRVLPHLGSDVRADLLALAQAAREREEVLDRILAPVADAVVLDSLPDGRLTVDRRRLNLYPPPVRAELLRSLIRTQGGRISRRGMAMALEFLASPRGSGRLTAGPGLLLVREGKKGHIQCIAGAVQDDRS